jgi:hypothetical protein
MLRQKLLLSKRVRSAMIPAALFCAIVSGCADEAPTAPKLPRIARSYSVPFNRFFIAWSQDDVSSPIQTQLFALDTRQDRQYSPFVANGSVLSFASANPGRLYFNGDEPDQYCLAPEDYAVMYHDFVEAVRGADPTARVSPAGFAEPNDRCCPVPTGEEGYCPERFSNHSIGYAEKFYNAFVQRYGVAPRVDEWRFHDFGIFSPKGDVNAWWSRIDKYAAWSVAHGANMVLGAWGFNAWDEPVPVVQEHMKQAMGLILNDSRINGAVYWSYQTWEHSRYPLATDEGSLTFAGQTFVNPLTDIPTGVEIVGSGDTQAQLRWGNTTSAWAAEAEFWVQAPGSSSFVYRKTALVAGPGGAQTPLVAFNGGEIVKGRVRYYNVYGQAAWSSFSNIVLMASAAAPPPPPPPLPEPKVDKKRREFGRGELCSVLHLC